MRSSPIDIRGRGPYDPDQFPLKEGYAPDVAGILAPGGEIEERIGRMAEEIARDRRGRGGAGSHLLCVLKGGMRFFDALTPRLELGGPYSMGVVRTSRYSEGQPGSDRAEVRLLDPGTIEGADVLVVEDMVDEGHTLSTLLGRIRDCDPNSVETAVLFDKVDRRAVEVDVEYAGFVIPDEFVVGYGIDYDERYRDLRHLAVLEPSVMEP